MTITIDEMLDLLSFAGTERANGNANHGPMAAEALFTLDRGESVLPWAEQYKSGSIDAPEATNPISRSDWREFLGDRSRLGDCITFFDRELAEKSWQDTLQEWVTPLAPAVMAAATHGLLRTSHAVRSLAAQETPSDYMSWLRAWGIGRPDTKSCRVVLRPPTPDSRPAQRLPKSTGCTGLISKAAAPSNNRSWAWTNNRSSPRPSTW